MNCKLFFIGNGRPSRAAFCACATPSSISFFVIFLINLAFIERSKLLIDPSVNKPYLLPDTVTDFILLSESKPITAILPFEAYLYGNLPC